jgi:hypothetical protein
MLHPAIVLQGPVEEDLEVLYCVACEKHFKSDAAFANHER